MIQEQTVDNTLTSLVKFHAYVATVGFVCYMFVVAGTSMFDFYQNLYQLAIGTLGPEARGEIGIRVLRDLAFTIVLYKGFTVLLSYARSMHINTKLVLELAIIAPVIELIFNAHALTYTEKIIYAAFAVGISFVYLFCYESVKQIK